MGDVWSGGDPYQAGQVDLRTPEQQQFISGGLTGAGAAGQAYQDIIQPGDFEQEFQKTIADPAMLQYQQRVLPAITQQFVDANAGSSSAMNQAMAASAQDLTTMLGAQYGQFAQQQRQNQLTGLGQMGQLAGQQTQLPLIGQQQGIGGNITTLLATIAPYIPQIIAAFRGQGGGLEADATSAAGGQSGVAAARQQAQSGYQSPPGTVGIGRTF